MMKTCVTWFVATIALFYPLCITNAQATDDVYLSSGWNFISFPKQPSDPSMNAVLKDISPNVRVAWGYDNQTKEWLRYRGGLSGKEGQRTLTTMDAGKGYWIYMDASGTTNMTNWSAPSATIAAYLGWNLIGYFGADGADAVPAINAALIHQNPSVRLEGKWDILWNWTQGIWYATTATVNSLSTIQPLTKLYQGRAYWIKIKTLEQTNDSCGTWDSSVWDNSLWCQ